MIHRIRISIAFLILASGLCAATISSAATLSEISSEPFGTFNDVEFVRHKSRFSCPVGLSNASGVNMRLMMTSVGRSSF